MSSVEIVWKGLDFYHFNGSVSTVVSLNKWWSMKLFDVYGLNGWDEHATLAQKTLISNN